jgi:hypothetical protein
MNEEIRADDATAMIARQALFFHGEREMLINARGAFIHRLSSLCFAPRFCRISRQTERERERERERAASIAASSSPGFPARHIVLPVAEARRRVPLHNILRVLERVDASG